MMLGRRGLAAGLGGLALGTGMVRGARAQGAAGGWKPDRPARIVVPFTPGGSTDILARALAAELQEVFGQPFVVENRGGAGGTIGTEVVAHAPPDGLTLMMGHIGTLAVNPALYPNLPFDTATAFAPIVLAAIVPNILVVNPKSFPKGGVPELIALAKSKPGALSYGSGGNGSAAHIAAVAFSLAAGIEMTHVPYRGTAPMMNDLISGTIDLTLTGGPPVLPPVRAGMLRALGVTSLDRLSAAPELPTMAEQGLPGFEATQWYGLVAPARTPPEIINRFNVECTRILKSAKLQPRLEAEGAVAAPDTPEAFGRFITAERERWGEVVRRANVQAN
ncbi:Bug family tripartite tricarboxylate transporter substrate binding protein [Roseomonas elaeocarpi]|uniref:Bug family tripartite tricarboxylate transporter substrate binding protein n=1 Tax=Roseomonas elaeocarpi TaxID=907779 RepID=A0ABV6JPI1_9PROT